MQDLIYLIKKMAVDEYLSINSKKISILFFFMLTLGFSCRSVGQNSFDKSKWKSSSEYRSEIVRSTNFPSFDNRSKKYITNILGEPSYELSGRLYYCLYIESLTNNIKDKQEKEACCKCEGSYLIVDPNVEEPFSLTLVNVEPLPKYPSE